MDALKKFELMEKITRELEDLRNSQTAIFEQDYQDRSGQYRTRQQKTGGNPSGYSSERCRYR